MKKISVPWCITGAVCFLLAAVIKFCLIGYGITALLLLGIGVCIFLYLLLPKKLKTVLTVLLVLGCAVFTAALIPVIRASAGSSGAEADYIIVLGAGVNGSTPSLSMVNRLDAALAYLEANPGCTAVLTGGQGQGENITEATAMADWLCAHGVSPDRLLLEEKATSTVENLRFSFELIPDAANARIAVCSSEYHLCRAQRIAQALGYSVGSVPGRTTFLSLRVNYFIREAFGILYMDVFGI